MDTVWINYENNLTVREKIVRISTYFLSLPLASLVLGKSKQTSSLVGFVNRTLFVVFVFFFVEWNLFCLSIFLLAGAIVVGFILCRLVRFCSDENKCCAALICLSSCCSATLSWHESSCSPSVSSFPFMACRSDAMSFCALCCCRCEDTSCTSLLTKSWCKTWASTSISLSSSVSVCWVDKKHVLANSALDETIWTGANVLVDAYRYGTFCALQLTSTIHACMLLFGDCVCIATICTVYPPFRIINPFNVIHG